MIGPLAVSRLRIAGEGSLRVGLLADTHIGADRDQTIHGGYNSAAASARAVEQALRAKLDIGFFLGDLARSSGEDGDYVMWREIFAPLTSQGPAILLPGNHDRRDHMLTHFGPGAPPDTERVVSIVETDALRLIALDSLYRTDVVPGLLGETQRNWLSAFLDAQDYRPTVVLVHHHLGEDDWALLDGDRLLALLLPRTQVKAVVTAHQHTYRRMRIDGLHLVAAPALGMPFKPEEPLGWLEASFEPAGVALRFHSIQGSSIEGVATEDEHRLLWRS